MASQHRRDDTMSPSLRHRAVVQTLRRKACTIYALRSGATSERASDEIVDDISGTTRSASSDTAPHRFGFHILTCVCACKRRVISDGDTVADDWRRRLRSSYRTRTYDQDALTVSPPAAAAALRPESVLTTHGHRYLYTGNPVNTENHEI